MGIQRRLRRSFLTMVAGIVATRLVTAIWRVATKESPPEDTEDLEVSAPTAVAFAGLLGAASAVAHTIAVRHAKRTTS